MVKIGHHHPRNRRIDGLRLHYQVAHNLQILCTVGNLTAHLAVGKVGTKDVYLALLHLITASLGESLYLGHYTLCLQVLDALELGPKFPAPLDSLHLLSVLFP